MSWAILRNVIRKTFLLGGRVGYLCCIGYCAKEYVGDAVVCQGPSMEPTLYTNDVILTEHVSVIREKIKKGDIVIARSPSNPNKFICKRVRGLPGDKIRSGLTSNVVPYGHIWLEGDNRNNSTDSRTYGPIPMGLLKSRAFCKVYPFKKFRMFSKK